MATLEEIIRKRKETDGKGNTTTLERILVERNLRTHGNNSKAIKGYNDWIGRVNSSHDKYVEEAKSRVDTYQPSDLFSGYADKTDAEIRALADEGQKYREHFIKYGDLYGADMVNKIRSSVDDVDSYLHDLSVGLGVERRYWEGFTDLEDFNTKRAAAEAAKKEAEEYAKKKEEYKAYDFEAGERKIAGLEEYATRYNAIQDEIKEIDGSINHSRAKGYDTQGLQAKRNGLVLELQSLSKEYDERYGIRPQDTSNFVARPQTDKVYGITLPNTEDRVPQTYDFNKLLSEAKAYHEGAQKFLDLDKFSNYGNPSSEHYDPDFEKWAAEGAKNNTFSDTGVDALDYMNLLLHGGADYSSSAQYLTEDQRKNYNYLWYKDQAEGTNTAQQYLDYISKETLPNASYGFGSEHPFLASLMSVPTSLASGIEFVGDSLKYLGDSFGNPYTAKMDSNGLAETTSTLRQGVSDTVDWNIGNWDAFDFLYNTAMSGVDSLAAGFIPGGGVVLGLSAAAQGTNDALERGMSSEQAFWNGAAQGFFEGLFESISIGKFKNLQEATVKGGKDIALNIVKAMLVNASEEAGTEVASILYDTIVNGEFANYTWEELENGAWKDALGQVLESAASGALMGVGFGGIGSAISYNKFKNQDKTSIDLGSPDSYAYDMSTVIQEYLDGVNNDILEYANECRVDKNAPYKRMKISDVGAKQAQDAQKLLGIDFTGYQNSVERSALNHIEKRHGENGTADNTMKDLNDVSRIGYVLENYDTVELTTDADGNEKFSKQFRDKNNDPAPLLKYTKKINGTYYAVIACPDSKYKKLWLVSAYIQKNNSQVTQESDAKTPDSTSKTRLASPMAATNSIPQDPEFVNSENLATREGQARNYARVLKLGESGLKGLISVANHSSGNMANIAQAYNAVYQAAKQGKAITDAKNPYLAELTPTQKLLAYEYGVMDSLAKKTSGEVLQKDEDSGTIENDSAIWRYKSSESYKINEAIRSGRELSAEESAFIEELDRELEKTPKYSGVSYRNISFDMEGQEAFEAFVAEHVDGEDIMYPAYTSTSKSKTGYLVDGELTAHLEIYGENGYDISRIGNEEEQEVLFDRKTEFEIKSIDNDGKTVNIVLEEIGYGEKEVRGSDKGDTARKSRPSDSEGRTSSMQQMQTVGSPRTNEKLPYLSRRDTQRNTSERNDLQGFSSEIEETNHGVQEIQGESSVHSDNGAWVRGEVNDSDPDVQQAKENAIDVGDGHFEKPDGTWIGKNPTANSETTSKKITPDISDADRYDILKDKEITVESSIEEDVETQKYSSIIDALEKIHPRAKSKAEKIIRGLAEDLGILNCPLNTPELDFEFIFSKNKSLPESLSKQLKYGGSYADFAKVLINLKSVLNSAILIEQHSDKYEGKIREDRNLKAVYVLFSALKDGNRVIPIQLEVKDYSHIDGRLYLTVALTKIEADVLGSTVDKNNQAHSLISASTYSIAEIFKNVNTADKHFLKYLPDGFLSEEQIKAKQEALAEDKRRIDAMPDKEQQAKENAIEPERVAYSSEKAMAYDAVAEDKLSEDQKRAVGVGKDIGLKVEIADTRTADGVPVDGFLGNDGVIYISKNNKSPVAFIFKHELAHFCERAGQKYRDFMKAVQFSATFKSWLKKKGYSSMLEYNSQMRKERSEVGIDPGEDGANNEIIANFVAEMMFGDDATIADRLIGELKPKQKRSVREFLRDFFEWIKGRFTGKGNTARTEIHRLEKMFGQAFRTAVKVEQGSGEQFAFNDSFGQQLRDWQNGNGRATGTYNGRYFKLGTTPDILIKHGAPSGEVIMFEDCLLKITGLKHSISLDELAKIPSQLNDPILLFKGSVENSFVALTEIKDKLGNDVIVAIHINKKMGRSVINKITSVYSKTDDFGNNKINNYVTDQIKKGNLLDASTKKAPNWFTTSGLQLPHVVQTILDANNSIAQKSEKSTQNSKKFSEDSSESFSYKSQNDKVEIAKTYGIMITDEQLTDNALKVTAMNNVALLTGAEFEADGKSSLKDKVIMFFNDLGNKVQTQEIGEVALTKTSFSDDKGHGLTRNKIISFGAIPEVLQNGRVIDVYKPKGKPYVRVTVAAPIEIAREKYYMGVMVQKDKQSNRMYLHDVITEKATSSFSNGANHQNGEGIRDEGHLFITSILQKRLGVNTSTKIVNKKISTDSANKGEEQFLYTPQNDRVEDIVGRYENGEITIDELKRLLKKPEKDNPVTIANLKPEDMNTTPSVTKKTTGQPGDGDSKFADSVKKSKIFDEKFKAEVGDDNFVKHYRTITNKETLAEAAKLLDEGGEEYVAKWRNQDEKRMGAIDTAVGFILLKRYQDVGDYSSAAAVAQKIRNLGTIAGQNVQIFSIIGRFDADMMQAYAQKELDEALEKAQKAKGKAWAEKNKERFKLSDEEIAFIRDNILYAAKCPDGSRDRAIALAEICTLIQNKLPAKKGQWLRAWQRSSMLLNPKTLIRNIAGNGVMVPVFIMSDWFAAPIDRLASKKTGIRTTGVSARGAKEAFKGVVKGGKESADDYRRKINTRLTDLNRFNIGEGKSYNESTRFKALNKVAHALNEVDRFTSVCIEWGDRTFYEAWFMRSLENQKKLNGVNEPTEAMIEIAALEALERTWQDDNGMTAFVTNIKNGMNKLSVGGYGLGDVFIKFAKTPANLTKAIYDYSPAALISVGKVYRQYNRACKEGTVTPALQKRFVSTVGKALSGTMVYLVAAALFELGLLSGAGDEDDDTAAYERYIQGKPSYSIKIGDKWFSYDWAQPIGAAAAIVVDFMESREEGEDWFTGAKRAVETGGKVLFDQSFMSSLNNFFSKNPISATIVAIMEDPATLVPTVFSQTANLFDDKRRVAYDSTSELKTALNRVLVKIPGVRNTLEADVDIFGREVPNSQNDVWNAYFNPGNTYTDTSDEVTNHVYEIYKSTGDKSAFPKKAEYSVTIKGKDIKLNTVARAEYQTTMGEISHEMIEALLENDVYNNLGDSDKLFVLNRVYEYAAKAAKCEVDGVYSYEVFSKIRPYVSEEEYNDMTEEEQMAVVDKEIFESDILIRDLSDVGMANYLVNAKLPAVISGLLVNGDVDKAIELIGGIEESVATYELDEEYTNQEIKDIKSDIKKAVTSYWKAAYGWADEKGNTEKKTQIEEMIRKLGLYVEVKRGQLVFDEDLFEDWLEEYKKKKQE